MFITNKKAEIREKVKVLDLLPTTVNDAKLFYKFCLQILGVNPSKDMTLFCEDDETYN